MCLLRPCKVIDICDDYPTRWAPTSYKWSYSPYKWPKMNGLLRLSHPTYRGYNSIYNYDTLRTMRGSSCRWFPKNSAMGCTNWRGRQVCVMRTFCPWHIYTMGPQNLHCLRVFLVDNVVFQALAKFQLRDFKYTRQALHCDRRASDLWIRGSDEPQQLCGGTHRHSSYLVKPQDTDIWNITPTLLWSTPTHVRELNSSKKILKVEDFEQAHSVPQPFFLQQLVRRQGADDPESRRTGKRSVPAMASSILRLRQPLFGAHLFRLLFVVCFVVCFVSALPRWNRHMSKEQNAWLLRVPVRRGLYILHSFMGIMINHDKDPFSTTSITESLWLACVTHFSTLQLQNDIHWSFIEGMPDEASPDAQCMVYLPSKLGSFGGKCG